MTLKSIIILYTVDIILLLISCCCASLFLLLLFNCYCFIVIPCYCVVVLLFRYCFGFVDVVFRCSCCVGSHSLLTCFILLQVTWNVASQPKTGRRSWQRWEKNAEMLVNYQRRRMKEKLASKELPLTTRSQTLLLMAQ